MYVSMTTTQGDTDDMIAVAAMAGESMVGWLHDVEGFEGLLMLSNEETGTTHVITFWQDADVAERSRASRLQLRDRITAAANVEVQETQAYAVSFADLGGFATVPSR
jgi:hypothetical protein